MTIYCKDVYNEAKYFIVLENEAVNDGFERDFFLGNTTCGFTMLFLCHGSLIFEHLNITNKRRNTIGELLITRL